MTRYIKDSALPDCYHCKNTRILHGGESVYQCQCSKKGVPLMRFLDTTIGRMYHGASLGALVPMDAPQTQLIGHAKRFVEWYGSGKKGLYLWSKQAGNGKSLVASAIVNAIGLPSQAIEASQLWDALRSCYDSNEPQARYMNVVMYVPALMLDDLGMGNTEKSDEWLTDILNARIEKGLLTIITSNLHPTQLKNASDRCISRIMSHTHPLEVKNVTDWRVKLKPYMSESFI